MHGVIFDLDGTLIHSLPGIAQGVNHALASHGYPGHSEAVIRSFIGNGLWTTCRRALPAEEPDDIVDTIRKAQIEYYAAHWIKGTTIYDGITELLTELVSKNIAIAVCTNKPHALAVDMVETLFSDYPFVDVIGDKPDNSVKPDPTEALKIAHKMNLEPSNIYFVGDSTIDGETGVNAGMHPQLVSWGYHDRPVLEATGSPLFDSVTTLHQNLLTHPQA